MKKRVITTGSGGDQPLTLLQEQEATEEMEAVEPRGQ